MPATLPTLALGLEYPLSYPGGVSVLVRELVKNLASSFRIVLVSPDQTSAILESEISEMVTAHVRWDPGNIRPSTARLLASELVRLGVEIAHFHCGGNYGWGMRQLGACPIPFVARRGVKCLTTVHLVVTILEGYCDAKKPRWFKLALLPLAWLGKVHALKHSIMEIAVSKHDEYHLKRWYLPFRNRYRQIYHSRLRSDDPIVGATRQTVVLNVGHLAHRKGQLLLAEAFALVAEKFPDWKLQFAGTDDEGKVSRAIEDLARKTGLSSRISCLGGRSDALSIMATAGIYVQPSIDEALGLALQEALFMGCPCIASTAGGIPELITDGDNGRLVPKGDAIKLSEALTELMSDSDLRRRFAERARPSILERGMTSETMVENYRSLYQSILS
jgi:glycosyltransferase involved in cell wall biosynthesis